MNFSKLFGSIWQPNRQTSYPTTGDAKVSDKLVNSEVEIVDKVGSLLEKLPGGGAVEYESEIIMENDPQAAVKLNMPQAGAEATASKHQKATKKVRLKVTKK